MYCEEYRNLGSTFKCKCHLPASPIISNFPGLMLSWPKSFLFIQIWCSNPTCWCRSILIRYNHRKENQIRSRYIFFDRKFLGLWYLYKSYRSDLIYMTFCPLFMSIWNDLLAFVRVISKWICIDSVF